ncbi:MAG: hypothetical protein WCX69_02925 [Candidatus Paceibacterota bacterium]
MGKNIQVDWAMKLSFVLLALGVVNYCLAVKADPLDMGGRSFGLYLSQWGAFSLAWFLIYVFLARRRREIAWLRIGPYVSGFMFLALGVPGALNEKYKAGDYFSYLWTGKIPTTISIMAEAYHPEIVFLAAICALFLVGVYLRR